jgi:hypothetical protein
MELENSLQFSQDTATIKLHQPVKSNSHPHTPVSWRQISIFSSCTLQGFTMICLFMFEMFGACYVSKSCHSFRIWMSLSWIPSILRVHLSRVPKFCPVFSSRMILDHEFVYFNTTDSTQQQICILKPLTIVHTAIQQNVQHNTAFIQNFNIDTGVQHLVCGF